ncbi:MAG: hypothetical protein KF830_13305 [Planctomycetes bacterium]|nr:hypothetical protein [Planctomycetota bacterium]
MHPSRLLPLAVLSVAASALAQAQFEAGAMYMMSPYHVPASGIPYPGIARIDPFTGADTPLVAFTSNGVYQASAAYDPFRDRIVAYCSLAATTNPALHAIDAAGTWTTISSQYLVRLAPRGDGKIYGYKAGAGHPDVQKVYYVDAAGQQHELLDVGGAQPWLLHGGVSFASADPIRAMIYEPGENALFLALAGDNAVPDCGAPSFDVSIRKLPLTADGTALRAPAVCAEYDVAGIANADERPTGFSYGPDGRLVLGVFGNGFGAMPRILEIDPATAQITPFATTGPYYGDINCDVVAYSPLTDRALLLDGGNDVWRAFARGAAGAGQILGSYGPPGLGGSVGSTLFVVGPIGPANSLSADGTTLSVAQGGVQQLDFHPGPALAGDLYLILGSLSGWAPGFSLGGFAIALNPDVYTDFTLNNPNSPFLVGTLGVLPPGGTALAQVVWPAAVLNGLAGLTMHHVAFGLDAGLGLTHASNPVPLQLLP